MIIIAEQVDVSTPTGPMRTYLHRPAAAGPWPAVVFYSEIFQQTGPIQRMARLIAGHGYAVAVPEVFHELEPAGTVLAYDDEGAARGNQHKKDKPIGAFDDDATALVDWLRDAPFCTRRIGALGVCLGGHLAYRCGMNPHVSATACCYPTDIHTGTLGSAGDDSLARTGEISGEVLMIFGRQDPHVPSEGRTIIHERLVATSRAFTWHELNAQHAFLRDEGPRYDAELALTAYRLLLDLFRRL
jgi:carboxymethylenebutenolidase